MTPDGWRVVKLAECADRITSGGTPRIGRTDYYGGDIPFLKIDDLTKNRGLYVKSATTTITSKALAETSAKLYPRRTVLVTMYGTIGAVGITVAPMAANQAIGAFLQLKGVTPEFLGLILQHEAPALARKAGQTTQSNISGKILKHHEVLLPPLSEQLEIAAILSSVDDAIEKTQSVIDQVQVVKRGLMQELLTRGFPGRHTRFKQTEIGEIPEEWEVVKISDVARRVTDGTHKTPKYVDHGIPFLSVNNLRHGCIDFSDCKFVSEDTHRELSKRCCPETGDLLVGKVATLGVVDVIKTTRSFSIFVQLALVKPTSAISSSFLKWAIRDKKCQRQIDRSSSGTGMKYIGIGRISNLLIPLPKVDEQNTIALRMDTLEGRIDAESAIRERLLVLRASLASTLFTGELRVTPDTEPA